MKKVLEWITALLPKAKAIINIIPKKVREYNSKSLTITANIKKVLDSPVTGIITTIIPGNWDDSLVSLMKTYLAKALPYLNIVDACKEHTELEAMMQCWITELRKLPKHAQDAILIKLAALLTLYQDGGALPQRLYDLYAQIEYVDKK